MTRSAARSDNNFGKFLGAILSLATWREETLISQSRLWMTDAIDVEFCNAKKQRPTLPIASRGIPRVFRFGLSLACTYWGLVVHTNPILMLGVCRQTSAQSNALPTLFVRTHYISSQFSRHLVPFLLGTYLDHMTSWKLVVSSCRRAVVNIGMGWMLLSLFVIFSCWPPWMVLRQLVANDLACADVYNLLHEKSLGKDGKREKSNKNLHKHEQASAAVFLLPYAEPAP